MNNRTKNLIEAIQKRAAEMNQTDYADLNKAVATFVMELLNGSTKTHITHLLVTGTGSFAAHKALGEFYDEVVEHADSIAEQYQGASETLLNFTDAISIPIISTKEQAITYLIELHANTTMLQSIMPYSEIVNELDSLKSLIDKTKYKLIFLA